jgi:hypothetical protein
MGGISTWDWPGFLESLGHFGVDLSLDRMQVLLQRLGQPQAGIPAIHVAGTNGKGSVCAWVSHVLWAAGYRVGRYTSPHLVDWRERIWLNGSIFPPPTGAKRWPKCGTVYKPTLLARPLRRSLRPSLLLPGYTSASKRWRWL